MSTLATLATSSTTEKRISDFLNLSCCSWNGIGNYPITRTSKDHSVGKVLLFFWGRRIVSSNKYGLSLNFLGECNLHGLDISIELFLAPRVGKPNLITGTLSICGHHIAGYFPSFTVVCHKPLSNQLRIGYADQMAIGAPYHIRL